jgi:glycosyltransferase involved in cell wall biosynthesis
MKEIGRNARKFVVENLDWRIIAEKYPKKFEKLYQINRGI